MNVEVERLRVGIIFLKPPPPPHYDLLPRQSHAAGTGFDKPGVSHAATQPSEKEGTFPFQAVVDHFLHVACIPEQEGTDYLISSRRGGKPRNNYKTSCRLPGVCEAAEKPAAVRGDRAQCRAKQDVWPRRVMKHLFLFTERWLSRVLSAPCVFSVYFLSAKFSVFIKQVREARRIFRQVWERLGYASKMDEK